MQFESIVKNFRTVFNVAFFILPKCLGHNRAPTVLTRWWSSWVMRQEQATHPCEPGKPSR